MKESIKYDNNLTFLDNQAKVKQFISESIVEQYENFEDFYDNSDVSDDIINIVETQYYHYIFDNKYRSIPFGSFFENQVLLNENLGKSIELSTQKVVGLLKKIKGVIDIKEMVSSYQITLKTSDEFDKEDKEFVSILNLYNYFIQSTNGNEISLEARKPTEVKNTYDYLYHVTTEEKWNKIKRVGLCPHKKNDLYPYRTYLFRPTENVKNDIRTFINLNRMLGRWDNAIVLKVDMKSFIPEYNVKIKLYKDPSYNIKSAVFTLENIPSSWISKIDLDTIQ